MNSLKRNKSMSTGRNVIAKVVKTVIKISRLSSHTPHEHCQGRDKSTAVN